LGQESLVSITEAPAAVRIEVSESTHLGDLKTYLEAAECAVQVIDTHVLEVSVPRAPSEAQAAREMTLYLGAWRVMNPGAHASIVDPRLSQTRP
jgi:hypothetical protein